MYKTLLWRNINLLLKDIRKLNKWKYILHLCWLNSKDISNIPQLMCNFNAKTIKIPGRSPTCLDGSPWPVTILWTWTRLSLSLEFLRLHAAGSVSRPIWPQWTRCFPQPISELCALDLPVVHWAPSFCCTTIREGKRSGRRRMRRRKEAAKTMTFCEGRIPLNTVAWRNLWNFHYQIRRWEPDYQFIWISPWGICICN